MADIYQEYRTGLTKNNPLKQYQTWSHPAEVYANNKRLHSGERVQSIVSEPERKEHKQELQPKQISETKVEHSQQTTEAEQHVESANMKHENPQTPIARQSEVQYEKLGSPEFNQELGRADIIEPTDITIRRKGDRLSSFEAGW
jgi:hypothetical protein